MDYGQQSFSSMTYEQLIKIVTEPLDQYKHAPFAWQSNRDSALRELCNRLTDLEKELL